MHWATFPKLKIESNEALNRLATIVQDMITKSEVNPVSTEEEKTNKQVTSGAENRNATKQSATSDFRLRLMLISLAAWTLFQTIRLVGLSLAQDALAGIASPAWLYPALTDAAIGLMAPFVTFALFRRKGLGAWVSGIVFFAISIVDHMDAATAALTTPIPPAPLLFNPPIATVAAMVVISIIDALAIAGLGTARIRSYLRIPKTPLPRLGHEEV